MPALATKPQEKLGQTATIFKALGDPTRLKILNHLASGAVGCCGDGVCACDLEELTDLTQPTISHHMRILLEAELVGSQKRGKWMYYNLNIRGLKTVQQYLKNCCEQKEKI